MKSLLIIPMMLLSLAACAKPATPVPTPTLPPVTSTATTAPATEVPQSNIITLTFEEYAQVEIVTPAGRHLYMDVSTANIPFLTKAPSADDILVTTHVHYDHFDADFQKAFPGKQLFISEGKIEYPDVTVIGLASAHNTYDPIRPESSSNYIYVIDVAGLRIAHFGDIGQESLNEAQLAALGTVDIAITQFSNSYSSMNASNLKGFNLMDQVKPKLIIPTHSDQATIKLATERWKGFYAEGRTITLSKDILPENESIVVMGNLAPSYTALFKLEPWK